MLKLDDKTMLASNKERYLKWQYCSDNPCLSTPIISYFIQNNSILIRFIVKCCRIMYYWNIIQRDESELVRKVFIPKQYFLSNTTGCFSSDRTKKIATSFYQMKKLN